ncbi:MAG: cell division protein FtsZ [Deltaproteobacteria bacterium]|nr:MAG: cell division protein FtsZ [Deltaproteobacteria bacterium]
MKFEIVDEKKRYNARIKVLGAGGAGGNAVNNMINDRLRGVDFIVANTDCQDLDRSQCPYKIQLGPSITMGLGAGADPEIGEKSAEESIDEIKEAVAGADMVFIAAGMGGGTGTGAAPVIARASRESGALTVAVVTKPFRFEAEKRMERAMEGIEKLKQEVDSLIVIPNERLKALGGKSTALKDLFRRADDVLLQAVRGISDLIMSSGFINLDFADVKKVMSQMGTAIMGMGTASGENRASEAAQTAINSPLLEDISISGAKGVLMNITGPSDMSMNEVDEASNFIRQEVSEDAEIFWGVVLDDAMEDQIQITVIATGIDGGSDGYRRRGRGAEHANVVRIRDVLPEDTEEEWTVRKDGVNLDAPAHLRKHVTVPDILRQAEKTDSKKGFLRKLRFKDNLDYPTFLRLKTD